MTGTDLAILLFAQAAVRPAAWAAEPRLAPSASSPGRTNRMVDVGLPPASKRGVQVPMAVRLVVGPEGPRAQSQEGIHGKAPGPLERAQHDRD
jgi:hypothetical protein